MTADEIKVIQNAIKNLKRLEMVQKTQKAALVIQEGLDGYDQAVLASEVCDMVWRRLQALVEGVE